MSDSARERLAPTFERARALAKQLLAASRAGDNDALARLRAQLPRLAVLAPDAAVASVRLADVQHALAREAGLASWAELKQAYETAEPLAEQVRRCFAALAEFDGATLRRVLASHPQVASTSLHAACAACDAALVEAWLARDAALATAALAGTSWTPLDCLAGSPLAALDDAHRAASVAIATRLLDGGASANQWTPEPGDTSGVRLTVLFRASRNGNAPLVALLLARGADPNDGESLPHAAELAHLDVLELLAAHGAELSAPHRDWGVTVLYYLAGYFDQQPRAATANAGMRWLLEHGADPNVPSYRSRETPLHRVADFGRDVTLAELLLAHGADPRRPRDDGRTPYDLAVRSGHVALVELLTGRGAATEPRPLDALLGACARGDEAGARRVLAEHPHVLDDLDLATRHAPVRAANHGRADALRTFAALGFDVGADVEGIGTPLHHAAWHGRPAAVHVLIELGVPLDPRDGTYGSSPLAWAAHGSHWCREADDDYIEVIDALLAAGATRETSFNRWGEPPEALASEAVAEHLRTRGFAPAE